MAEGRTLSICHLGIESLQAFLCINKNLFFLYLIISRRIQISASQIGYGDHHRLNITWKGRTRDKHVPATTCITIILFVIGFGLTSDWLKKGDKIFWLITKQCNARSNNLTLDSKLINNSWQEHKGNHYREEGLQSFWKFFPLFSLHLKISTRSYIKHSKEGSIR